MNWQTLIQDCRARGATLQEIKDACGFASRGHVLDLQNGNHKSILWDVGDALIRYHKRIMKRKHPSS